MEESKLDWTQGALFPWIHTPIQTSHTKPIQINKPAEGIM